MKSTDPDPVLKKARRMVEAMPDFGADFAPKEKLAGIVGRLTIYQYHKTKYADTAKADERVSLTSFD